MIGISPQPDINYQHNSLTKEIRRTLPGSRHQTVGVLRSPDQSLFFAESETFRRMGGESLSSFRHC